MTYQDTQSWRYRTTLMHMTATPIHRTNDLPPCGPANSLLESDLELAIQQQTLLKLTISETDAGFYVVVHLKWDEQKKWYLTTRRDRHTPRVFKDLNRLNENLKEFFPTEHVELLRNQKLPPTNNHQ